MYCIKLCWCRSGGGGFCTKCTLPDTKNAHLCSALKTNWNCIFSYNLPAFECLVFYNLPALRVFYAVWPALAKGFVSIYFPHYCWCRCGSTEAYCMNLGCTYPWLQPPHRPESGDALALEAQIIVPEEHCRRDLGNWHFWWCLLILFCHQSNFKADGWKMKAP